MAPSCLTRSVWNSFETFSLFTRIRVNGVYAICDQISADIKTIKKQPLNDSIQVWPRHHQTILLSLSKMLKTKLRLTSPFSYDDKKWLNVITMSRKRVTCKYFRESSLLPLVVEKRNQNWFHPKSRYLIKSLTTSSSQRFDKRNVAPNSFPVQSVQGLSQSQTKQNRQIGCKN